LLVLVLEWSRALVAMQPGLTVGALILGGVALAAVAAGWPAERLGLGTSRFGIRLLGGLALGAVLLLPAAVRAGAAPLLPAGLAVAAVAVSIGEELAFRGALYAALEDAVAAAGLLLALWRWACKDLVAPILGHVIADLAL